LKGKRFLGVPVSIIAVVLAVLLVGGGVLAAFFWTRSIPSTVKIIGGEVEAYENEACTIPLTALDYGEIRAGQTTDPVTFWLKNIGDDPVYCAIAQDELDALLVLYQGTDTVVPADPARLALRTGEGGTYIDTGIRDYTFGVTTAVATEYLQCRGNISGFPTSGVVRVDSELIAYQTKDNTALKLLTLTRGVGGTTPAQHVDNAVIIVQSITSATYNLVAGAKLAVSTYLVADPDIDRSDKPFTVIVEAKDTPY
jgi:hypothetical protein